MLLKSKLLFWSFNFLVSCFYSQSFFKVRISFRDRRGYFLSSWFFIFLLFWLCASVYLFFLIFFFFLLALMIISIFFNSGTEYIFDCSKATLIIWFIFILFCIMFNLRSSLLFVQLFAMIFRFFRSIHNILILIIFTYNIYLRNNFVLWNRRRRERVKYLLDFLFFFCRMLLIIVLFNFA